MKKRIKSLVLIIYMMVMCLSIVSTIRAEYTVDKGPEQGGKTVKVAVYELKGFSAREDDGNYSGYNIEYLNELSKYTGWSYEYVDCKDANEAVELIKKGKADIAGGIVKLEALEGVSYCEYNSGTVYDCLVTIFINELIYEDYDAFSEINIGCTMDYIHQKEFIAYANENGFTPKLTYYEDIEQLRAALRDGKIGAMLVNSMEREPDTERVIDKFFSEPFYFVTSQDNAAFGQALKDAISELKVNNSRFENDLNEKYFDETGAFPYTKTELNYLVSSPVIKVGIDKERMPVSYKNVNGNDVGIAIDVFNLLSQYSGLEFDLVEAKTDELEQMLMNGEIDLAAGVTYESFSELKESEMAWSSAYLESIATCVGKQGFSFKTTGSYKLGIVKGNELFKHYIKENYPKCEIFEYETTKDGLDDVVDGEIDGIIENSYVINALLLKPYYSGLAVVPTINIAQNYRFVGLRSNENIISILNKTIASISDDEINSCILHYTVTTYDYTIADYIYKYRVQLIIAAVVLVVIGAIGFRTTRIKKRANAAIAANEELLKNITNNISGAVFMFSGEKPYKISYTNEGFYTMTGMTKEMLGKPGDSKAFDFIINRKELFEGLENMKSDSNNLNNTKSFDITIKSPGNDNLACMLGVTYIASEDGPGSFYAVITDINRTKTEYELLKEKSKRDVLTKLYNKQAFQNLVTAFIENEDNKDKESAIIFVDIDNFKSVNDRLGHLVGDETLKKVAANIDKCTRDTDIVARFGGDEFCIFAVDIPLSGIENFASRLNRELNFVCTSEEEPGVEIEVSASIGIARFPVDGNEYSVIIDKADNALYDVKFGGKNMHKIYGIE